MVNVSGSIPSGDILAKMCGRVNALRVMHLHIRRRVIFSLCGDRTCADFPKVGTLNQLANQSFRTADNRPSSASISVLKEGTVNYQ